ncbi:MAG: cupin domain-containing protein [Actinocrinis sp.]
MNLASEQASGQAGETETGPLQADLDWCLAQAGESERGALWRLSEPGRHLDANLIRLPPNASVPAHTEQDVDVLLLAVAGSGTLHTDSGQVALATHVLTWMPHGTTRSITAGSGGLAYVTVHRARTGLRIQLPTDAAKLALLEAREEEAEREFEGGEAACLLPRICTTCGAIVSGPTPPICPSCSTAWDA